MNYLPNAVTDSESLLFDYKSILVKLELLQIMYSFELSNITFFIKSINNSNGKFNINHFIYFSTSARSGGFN